MFCKTLAFFLVHCCSTVTLARLERTIIHEVIRRGHWAGRNLPSPGQRWLVRWKAWRATRHLHRTLDRWWRE